MRTPLLALLGLSFALVACGGTDSNNKKTVLPQCSDGEDNDGDGMIDFPDDPGCIGPNDESEDSLPSPQCSDGRDNDNDGKVDFPQDPGCASAHQDTETDDCPDGPNCPQCSNNKDDDGNGQTDYPSDPGCTSASDTDEFTDDPLACGPTVVLKQLPFDGHVMGGNLGPGGPSNLMSPTCGGSGKEDVYELRLSGPKVIKATTNLPGTSPTTDTVLSVRGIGCTDELTCNDDDLTTGAIEGSSSVTASADTAGVYYLVVDNNSGLGGAYELQVNFLAGLGEACDPDVVSCGDGLVCRIPLNGTTNVCSHPMCSDGVDDDGDGQADYPTDPGCDTPDDNDETDTCPGAGCPQCADGLDNDGDGHTDYPDDPQCTAASTHSESCVDSDAVNTITTVTTSGTTTGAHNDSSQTCGSTTATAPEVTYRFHAPMQLASLNISTNNPSFDAVTAVYGPSCNGTALACSDFNPIPLTNLPVGDVYIVVDGYSTGSGTFQLQVNGVIKNNEICEDPLVSAGVLVCGPAATCQGTVGNKHCMPAACSDGVDNNGDGKIDYPNDPGCDSPLDATEDTLCPGVNCPVCADGMDNDTDTHIDYATDLSCWAASGNNEAFCGALEMDRALAITTYVTSGTTVGLHSDFATETCQSNGSGPDVALSFELPVPVTTITFDTVDPGTSFDTILSLRANTCAPASELTGGCNDDSAATTRSTVTMTNLAAGNYAMILDGYNAQSGTYVLHTHGSVANGTACTSPLFSTGVLSCTSPAICNGTVCM